MARPPTSSLLRRTACALAALVPPLAHAQPVGMGPPVVTGLAVLWGLFVLKTLAFPWFSSRRRQRADSWLTGVAFAALALAVGAAVSAAAGLWPATWIASAIVWQALSVATVGVALGVAAGVLKHGKAGAWPRVQQAMALAWLLLVPATAQWDRLTRHHHTRPPSLEDVRGSQLRPLTAAEIGDRLAGTPPPPGQCQLEVTRPGETVPVLFAAYGRGSGDPRDRLTAPAAWRDRSATFIGLGDGSLGLQDNVGLVRRTGLGWQLDVAQPWTWAQVQSAHAAHQVEAARQAERAGREAAWRAVDNQRRLLTTTPPDPNAESPLRLQPDSAFERLASPVVARALAAAQLTCTRSAASPSGWQCTNTREAWICPVILLSSLCEAPGRRLAGEVLNLQAGVPTEETGSDTSWFLFKARPAACVLLSRRLSDSAVRAASGPALLTCDATGADPDLPVPVLTAELPYPTESERSRLDDKVRDLRSAYDDALRGPRGPATDPLPFRINAMTDGEIACDAAAGPCRRFTAHLVADGAPLEVTERCSDPATAAAQSRFGDPFFKP